MENKGQSTCSPIGCIWGPPSYLIQQTHACFTPHVVVGFRVRCSLCNQILLDSCIHGKELDEGTFEEVIGDRYSEPHRIGPTREECMTDEGCKGGEK